jgi:hypothetical protein
MKYEEEGKLSKGQKRDAEKVEKASRKSRKRKATSTYKEVSFPPTRIISVLKWIWTSRLSIRNTLSLPFPPTLTKRPIRI